MSVPAPTVPDRSAPRRRRWSLSLRGVMGVILVAGGLAGWWARAATLRREAVAAIRAGGGYVAFADDPGYEDRAGAWTWLYRWTGVEACRGVARVSYEGPATKPPPPIGVSAPPEPTPDVAFREFGRLGRLERLREVESRGTAITPSDLRELAGARVGGLALHGLPAVTAPLLAEVGRIDGPERLTLGTRAATFDPRLLTPAAGLGRLKDLRLYGFARPGSADLAALGDLPATRTLALSPAPSDDAYLDRVGTAGQLVALDLRETRIGDAGLRRLVARSPGLEAITLDGSALTDAGVEALATLPRPRSVDLAGRFGARPDGVLTDASLVALGRARGLARLHLNAGHFTDRGIDALRGLPLRELRLGSVEALAAPALARLMASRGFEFLGLRGPAITDATVATLAAGVRGRLALDLSDSAITDAAMPALATISLSELCLVRTGITDRGLVALGPVPTLASLTLWETPVTPAGAATWRATHRFGSLAVGPIPEDLR